MTTFREPLSPDRASVYYPRSCRAEQASFACFAILLLKLELIWLRSGWFEGYVGVSPQKTVWGEGVCDGLITQLRRYSVRPTENQGAEKIGFFCLSRRFAWQQPSPRQETATQSSILTNRTKPPEFLILVPWKQLPNERIFKKYRKMRNSGIS